MKKLKLSFEKIKGTEILSRDQLKKVIGGEFGSSFGCKNRDDCMPGEKCSDGRCERVEEGTTCVGTGNDTCGKNQQCVININTSGYECHS